MPARPITRSYRAATTRPLAQAGRGSGARPTATRGAMPYYAPPTTRTLRGRGRYGRRVAARNPIMGIISIACFALYWLLAIGGFLSVQEAVGDGEDAGRLVSALRDLAILRFFCLAVWISGLITGILAVSLRGHSRVLGIVGLSLNGLVLLISLIIYAVALR